MKTVVAVFAVFILSGCGMSSMMQLALSDWSLSAAENRAEQDFKEGKAQLFETGCPSRGPIGIEGEDLQIVKSLPREHFPCGCVYRDSAEMKLCSKKYNYGLVYNKLTLMLSKERDNKEIDTPSAIEH